MDSKKVGTGLKSKVEGVDVKEILKELRSKIINECVKFRHNEIPVEEYHTVLDYFIFDAEIQLRQSIERETIEKVEKICEELLGQDEKYKIIVAQGNIYVFSYNHAICDVKQKLKEIENGKNS